MKMRDMGSIPVPRGRPAHLFSPFKTVPLVEAVGIPGTQRHVGMADGRVFEQILHQPFARSLPPEINSYLTGMNCWINLYHTSPE